MAVRVNHEGECDGSDKLVGNWIISDVLVREGDPVVVSICCAIRGWGADPRRCCDITLVANESYPKVELRFPMVPRGYPIVRGTIKEVGRTTYLDLLCRGLSSPAATLFRALVRDAQPEVRERTWKRSVPSIAMVTPETTLGVLRERLALARSTAYKVIDELERAKRVVVLRDSRPGRASIKFEIVPRTNPPAMLADPKHE